MDAKSRFGSIKYLRRVREQTDCPERPPKISGATWRLAIDRRRARSGREGEGAARAAVGARVDGSCQLSAKQTQPCPHNRSCRVSKMAHDPRHSTLQRAELGDGASRDVRQAIPGHPGEVGAGAKLQEHGAARLTKTVEACVPQDCLSRLAGERLDGPCAAEDGRTINAGQNGDAWSHKGARRAQVAQRRLKRDGDYSEVSLKRAKA